MNTATARAADWERFVAGTASAGGLSTDKLNPASHPFADGQLDSLAISELVLFLLEEYGLDLFDVERFAQATDWSLEQLHEVAWSQRHGAALA